MCWIKRTLVLFIMCNGMAVYAQTVINEFVPGRFASIRETYQNKPLLLAFWSLDCPSCYRELELLAELKNKYPQLNVVLVSTDIEASEQELVSVLNQYRLDSGEAWVFREGTVEQLRYEIDRNWYGELPRSYLFKPGQPTQVVSGLLREEALTAWLKN